MTPTLLFAAFAAAAAERLAAVDADELFWLELSSA